MSQKTRLSPLEQWDRTVALYAKRHYDDDTEITQWAWEADNGEEWLLAVILRPTKLFNAGDFVITSRNNGSGDRLWTYGVSSKCYLVNRMYLGYTTTYDYTRDRPLLGLSSGAWASHPQTRFGHPTMFIPQPPFYLAGRSFADSFVRQYAAALHNGTAEKLVRDMAATISFVSVGRQSASGLSAKDPSRVSDTVYPVSHYELGISPELSEALSNWVKSAYLVHDKRPPEEQFNALGQALAARVKQEVGENIEVVYAPLRA